MCSVNVVWHKVQALLKCRQGSVRLVYTRACFHTEVDPCGWVTCALQDPSLKPNSMQEAVLLQQPWRGNHRACANVGITKGLEKAHRSVPRAPPWEVEDYRGKGVILHRIIGSFRL